MNRTDVLRHIASLRNGAPMIISPGLANYPIAEAKDEPLTIYNMDMPYTTPMALGMASVGPSAKLYRPKAMDRCSPDRVYCRPLPAIDRKIF